jgi:hypothetical protein
MILVHQTANRTSRNTIFKRLYHRKLPEVEMQHTSQHHQLTLAACNMKGYIHRDISTLHPTYGFHQPWRIVLGVLTA